MKTNTQISQPTPASINNLSSCLNLFYGAGNISTEIDKLFKPAFIENKELAIKIMGWSRSIREGAGVRQNLRTIINSGILPLNEINWAWFVEHGYWKDIFYFKPKFFDQSTLNSILKLIKDNIESGNNLVLKWLPRKKKNKAHKNNKWIKVIRTYLKMTEKEYRKLCSSFVTTETLMCANRWNEIDYSKVPSKCMIRNIRSFYKHDLSGIKKFFEGLKENKGKVNTGAIYPHEILKLIIKDDDERNFSWEKNVEYNELAENMWKSFGAKINSERKILVIGDTSGSMVYGNRIFISLAMTIFCAERLTGPFHNHAITFSTNPSLIKFSDDMTLDQKLQQIPSIVEDTNIEAVIDLILEFAKFNAVKQEDMPDVLLLISDMQFGQANISNTKDFEDMLNNKFKKTIYKPPKIVFWNVADTIEMAIHQDSKGIILFGGASINSIETALNGDFDPIKALLRVVDHDKYNFLIK